MNRNTFKKLELTNGEVVNLTMTFSSLLFVKNHDEKLYDRFMKIMQNKNFDIVFDALTVIYVGYICANLKSLEDGTLLSEGDFMDIAPFDIAIINTLAGELIGANKKK